MRVLEAEAPQEAGGLDGRKPPNGGSARRSLLEKQGGWGAASPPLTEGHHGFFNFLLFLGVFRVTNKFLILFSPRMHQETPLGTPKSQVYEQKSCPTLSSKHIFCYN